MAKRLVTRPSKQAREETCSVKKQMMVVVCWWLTVVLVEPSGLVVSPNDPAQAKTDCCQSTYVRLLQFWAIFWVWVHAC